MVSSSSLPIINRLQGVCSDLAEQTNMIRSYSDNCVTVTPHQNTTVTQDVSHVLSRTSSGLYEYNFSAEVKFGFSPRY